MRLDAGQHMRMDQRMKLSPRMIQSMEILQLAAIQLEERIEQELETNPILEIQENQLADNPEAMAAYQDAQAEAAGEQRDGEASMSVGENSEDNGQEDFRRLDEMSSQYGDDWDNTYESGRLRTRTSQTGDRDAKMDALANTSGRGASLRDQLMDQWRFVEIDQRTLQAGEHIIDFIENDGYLRSTIADMTRNAPAGLTEVDLEAALNLLQARLEPAGIGARTLGECLLLQIDTIEAEEGIDDELETARLIITDYLEDLGMNRLPKIVRQTGLPMEQVKGAVDRLRKLDPKPGLQLAPEENEVIVPDVIIEFDPVHDRYVAGLNNGRQPALRINVEYQSLAKDKTQDRGTRDFLNRNLNNATWLIDSINQRNNTLLRVVNAVLDVQREFFDHGPQHLKPLPMIQVAEQLGIHVGTVSRAVADKYIQSPRGIYPLRQFFSGGTESSEGDEMSWTAIQAKMKEVVDNEDPLKPYSDDALVEVMAEQGIKLARRTVAKYRKQLNIPTARQRRQY